MLDGESRKVEFLARLHHVAAVDEDDRAVLEHDGDAGRAGKTGEPSQPLGAGRHVFVLVAVGARHDEAVEAAPLELGAQRRQPRRARRPLAAILERLEMRLEHGVQSRSAGDGEQRRNAVDSGA